MQLRHDQFDTHLKGALQPSYVISSDEPLLALEAADKLRIAARDQGFSERNTFELDARSDWQSVLAATQVMSLFGDRRLIELRIATGKPGKTGAQVLQQVAQLNDPSVMTVLVLPRLDKKTRAADWVGAFEAGSAWLEIPVIDRAALPHWLLQRLSAQQQSVDSTTAQWLADRVEGNLLAAQQEIKKLGLLYESGTISAEQVQDAVLNVARYDVFKLGAAMLSGNLERTTRMIEGLRGEGESAVLVHWAITDDVRQLARVSQLTAQGMGTSQAVDSLRLWGDKKGLIEQAARHVTAPQAQRVLERAASLERMLKGVGDVGTGDDWAELLSLAAMVCKAVNPARSQSRSTRFT